MFLEFLKLYALPPPPQYFKKIFYILYFLITLVFVLDILNKHYRKGEIEAFAKFRDFSITRILHSFIQLHTKNNLFTDTKEYEKNYEKIYLEYKGSVKSAKKIPHIVLVIGESAQRAHLSLYGNALDTTPLARKLEKEGNLIKFSDTIAPYAQTRFVLDFLLNFASAGDKDFTKRLNMIDLFKLGGYKSAYFSNQELASINTRLITAIANRADVTRFFRSFCKP
ncbi:sulfatase-like hydrolase/transferase [Helicobacter burdigaliensis]|uniref:sulfatase-like hydrolase/transferase n=1 Tax=Helicobacter burdigaliensis TaxID=2315334 RepID=UPI000EF70440|nr:sulfatase-like hydrolase/transferase [Helicobacter burdigaliensis]